MLRRDTLQDALAEHPRLPLALKSALAASAAWLAVQPFGGVADRYPYYAPLGAVVAMGATVVSTLRASLQSILAIVLGAVLGVATRQLPVPEVAAIAVVVAAGTLVAGWQRLGTMASWVPVSALFILIIGKGDHDKYAAAYLGFTAVGAVIGLAVNVLAPQLPVTPARVSESKVLESLAAQLRDLADGLQCEPHLTAEQWRERQRPIKPRTDRMLAMIAVADESRRVNWRAHRWNDSVQRQSAQARSLQQLALLVQDITDLVTDREHAHQEHVALGPELRAPTAEALNAMAGALWSVDSARPAPDALHTAEAGVEALVVAIRDVRGRTGEDLFAAGAMVSALRRGLAALGPPASRSGAGGRRG